MKNTRRWLVTVFLASSLVGCNSITDTTYPDPDEEEKEEPDPGPGDGGQAMNFTLDGELVVI